MSALHKTLLTWGIAFGRDGLWAVADDYPNHCVYLFDNKDQLIKKFGSHGSTNGEFNNPRGLHLIGTITCM